MNFPLLLSHLYTSSFTTGPISGGFRRAGVWLSDENAMKEKVVHLYS